MLPPLPNISKFLKKASSAIDIIEVLGNQNAKFVGGCVRDAILGKQAKDIDIASSLKPNQVIEVLQKANIKTIPTGIKHGTITAIYKNQTFEITTLRKDVTTDGRHAEVAFTDSWQEDAKRRDFSINALYFNTKGEIFDYFNGLEDLKSKKVIFIGDAKTRIEEDNLRILRYFRFFQRFGGKTHNKETLNIIGANINLLKNLSGERIFNELSKIFSNKKAEQSFNTMQSLGVFKQIFGFELAKNKPLIFSSYILNFLCFINSLNELKEISSRLKFANNLSNILKILINLRQEYKNLEEKDINKIAYIYGKKITKYFITYCFINEKNTLNKKLKFLKILKIKPFPVKGKDLKKIGFSEGKQMGELLKKLEAYYIKNNYEIDKKNLKDIINNNFH